MTVSERFVWAVELLDVQADDRLLEIGCGHGIAVSLICDRLTSGKIVALDHSQKMINAAQQRNADCSDHVEFYTGALDQADFEGRTFNKIFCINVNVFWQKPQKELAVIRQLLAGTFYIIYEPPTAEQIDHILETVKANLNAHQFAVVEVHTSGKLLCIKARSAG